MGAEDGLRIKTTMTHRTENYYSSSVYAYLCPSDTAI